MKMTTTATTTTSAAAIATKYTQAKFSGRNNLSVFGTKYYEKRFWTICHAESTDDDNEETTEDGSTDEEEWNALISAFQMYKAAYGDLKVPTRFIVPAMPPWSGKS